MNDAPSSASRLITPVFNQGGNDGNGGFVLVLDSDNDQTFFWGEDIQDINLADKSSDLELQYPAFLPDEFLIDNSEVGIRLLAQ